MIQKIMLLSILIASHSFAAEFEYNGTGEQINHSVNAPAGGGITITQSVDTSTITALNSVACPPDDDAYFRRFDLTVDGITNDFNVSQVSVAIETADPGMPLTANIYSLPKSSTFEFANLSLLGSATQNTIGGNAYFETLPVSATLSNPSLNDLVFEVFAPDFTNSANFFIGSNAGGQTGLSFLSSAGCGAVEPTELGSLGFPNMHIIMNVTGTAGPPPPPPPPPVSVPTINSFGLIVMVIFLSIIGIVGIRRRA